MTKSCYIHIPFCKQKCFYCDFISYENKQEIINKYVEALQNEIIDVGAGLVFASHVDTIYIGGGTPSFIDSKHIVSIINTIKETYNVKPNAEITIEVNPGTVSLEKLQDYKEAGINRLSIGLQSAENELLKQIGRIHSFEQFLETYEMARKVGFKNINVDLMLGLPNQKIKDLKNSLEKVIELHPEHISVYSLIVEDGTPIANKIASGELQLPEEDTERNMYWYVKNTLELNGYKHYEISNFAQKGCESRHNLNCWKQKEYIGMGLAAHSYRDITRYSNTENLSEYIRNIQKGNLERNRIIHEIQKEDDTKKEYMILGLRQIDGIQISEFKEKFVDNPIYLFRNQLKKLVEEELINIDENNIRLTNKGIDFANLVWEEFV